MILVFFRTARTDSSIADSSTTIMLFLFLYAVYTLTIFCDTVCACCVEAPQPVEPWGDDVIRSAVEFGPSCPQMLFESDNSLEPRDEDCLHLNIYSPYEVSNAPVLPAVSRGHISLVFLHVSYLSLFCISVILCKHNWSPTHCC